MPVPVLEVLEKRKILPLPVIEPLFPDHPAGGLVTIRTELFLFLIYALLLFHTKRNLYNVTTHF